jgi:predicted acyltransferase
MNNSNITPIEFKPGMRLVSLDALRGLTIAGMILVNDPGSWNYIYEPLEHAVWNGITPTDLVFPFFLFIVGVSIALVYTKLLGQNTDKKELIKKLVIRSLMIFGFGAFLHFYPKFFSFSDNPFIAAAERLTVILAVFIGLTVWKSNFKIQEQTRKIKIILWVILGLGIAVCMYTYDGFVMSEYRIPGVLQRIAVVYFICSMLFLYTTRKTQALIGTVILLGYWVIMYTIPTPGYGKVMLEPGQNLAAWLDSVLISGKMYQGTWDPEGLLSTLPSVATGICGMLVGTILLGKNTTLVKLVWLFSAGLIGFLAGGIWDWFFPINKNLWSSSFVLYTGGAATMGLAASVWFVDVLGYKKWTKFGVIFGSNALAAYLLHGMIYSLFFINFGTKEDSVSVNSSYFKGMLELGFSHELVSLIWAILYVLLCFIPIWWLYKKKIFIKV